MSLRRYFSDHKRSALFLLIVVFSIAGYIGVMEALARNPMLNQDVVLPNALIRSGQPQAGDIEGLQRKYGIKTILCLNTKENPEIKDYASGHGIKVIGMSMHADDPPTPDQLKLFFDLMSGATIDRRAYGDAISYWSKNNPDRMCFDPPILMHCLGGSDRTGIMVALYRITFQGWTKERSKREMMMHFHVPPMHPELFKYIDKYDPATRQSAWRKPEGG